MVFLLRIPPLQAKQKPYCLFDLSEETFCRRQLCHQQNGKQDEVTVEGEESERIRQLVDTNRSNGSANSDTRSAATVHRLNMYKRRPKREKKGKILKHEFQEQDLPNTRIQPDRRWFGNTRVVNQKELEFFRDELRARISEPGTVLLQQKKLPLSLLNDYQKQARVHLLKTAPFQDAFGPKRKRKRPTLLARVLSQEG